jgi:ketosteroid isomerase-like protein
VITGNSPSRLASYPSMRSASAKGYASVVQRGFDPVRDHSFRQTQQGGSMHTKAFVLSTVTLLVAAVCFANYTSSNPDETKAVERATTQFYTSLNAMFTGDAGPMQEIWSHADDVTYMGPGGGFKVGWNDVRQVWEAQAALKLVGKVEPRDLHITVGNDLAFSQCVEQGNNLDAEGRTVQVSIRATNLFRKENGNWKMIGHHTDLLPFLEKDTLAKSAE